MNHNKLFVLLISMFFHFNVMEARDYVQYVDPYIGSGGHGHVFVGEYEANCYNPKALAIRLKHFSVNCVGKRSSLIVI